MKMNLKKQFILRFLIGMPIGLLICYFITLFISIGVGDGNFYPVQTELTNLCKSQLNAVIVQTIAGMIYGGMWGGASVIWEVDSWSLTRQTVTHLIVISVTSFPIAYVMRWMPQNIYGILIYCAIFFFIYFGIWLGTYCKIKAQIKQINSKINS